jgi:chromosome segregation ATPase
MIERITLSKENARLSMRLQELHQQVNRVQNERADVARLCDDLNRQLQENGRKLDHLLTLCSGKNKDDRHRP